MSRGRPSGVVLRPCPLNCGRLTWRPEGPCRVCEAKGVKEPYAVPVFVRPAKVCQRKPRRPCETCGKPLSPKNRGTLCGVCLVRRPCAGGCGGFVGRNCKTGALCHRCRYRNEAANLRPFPPADLGPTHWPPGSEERMAVYAARVAELGQTRSTIFDPGDARDDDDAAGWGGVAPNAAHQPGAVRATA